MSSSPAREVRVQIDRVVVNGFVPGLGDARRLEAAVAVELGRLFAGDAGDRARDAAELSSAAPAVPALARQIALELYRRVGRLC